MKFGRGLRNAYQDARKPIKNQINFSRLPFREIPPPLFRVVNEHTILPEKKFWGTILCVYPFF